MPKPSMTIRKLSFGGLLLLSSFIFILASCTNGSQKSIIDQLRKNAEEFEYAIGTRGGALTVATISEPLTLNLAVANDASSSAVLGYLFEGLTEISWLTDEVEPALAKSWERSENGLIWTFHLRDDVTWHDGNKFTADDVVFTFNRIIYNDDISTSDRSPFNFWVIDQKTGARKVEKMTVTRVDASTVKFELPVPHAPFLRSMNTAVYPKHILEEHVDAGNFASTWDINTDPSEVIGTGPFTIKSYRPGAEIVMVRYGKYWLKDSEGDRLPYLDEIVRIIVPDLETELDKFEEGAVDVHGLLGEEFEGLEPRQEELNFTIYRRGPGFGTNFLGFNMNPGTDPKTGELYLAPEKLKWFQKKEFRQAVAHSIDKDAIINEAHHGLGYPQWSSVSPAAVDFHNPDVRRYEYGIGEANRILDDIGWIDTDGDDVREDDEGNEIAFSFVTNSGNSVREEIGRIIKDGLGSIGVKADYRLVEFSQLVGQLATTYDWEAMLIGFTGGSDPHSGISFWHSSGNLHLWHPNQESPATDWEGEIDELYILGSQELVRSERIKHYHSAQEIVAENVPVVYTALSERLTAVRNVFGNTTPTLYGLWDIRYLYRTDLVDN